ncbi:Hypothetical protein NRBB51_1211 [Bifidobacterium breve]|uniref:Uncharacterized protein n=1 Tax=Bifidobacterium breve TaxID=1685 RepID=A0AAN1M319_BIFBR|nr:Hypothetical protein NRBB51_1211 [Bifidobacterium breve]
MREDRRRRYDDGFRAWERPFASLSRRRAFPMPVDPWSRGPVDPWTRGAVLPMGPVTVRPAAARDPAHHRL